MAPKQRRTVPTGPLYLQDLSTTVIYPFPTLSHFFDDKFDTMSDQEKGTLMSYGKNSTHRFASQQEYDDADFMTEDKPDA